MSNDPVRISLDRLAELLRGLGLDPVDLKHTVSIHVDRWKVTVVRDRCDEAGNPVVLGGNEVATETVTIGLGE